MSCVATFYKLDNSKYDDFFKAKENEYRTEKIGFWIFKKDVQVLEKALWEFLDESSLEKLDFDYSGFLIVTYLWTYLDKTDDYLKSIDEYYSIITAEDSKQMLEYINSKPIVENEIIEFIKTEDSLIGDEELPEMITIYKNTYDTLVKWLSSIEENSFGILHLAF